MVDSSPLKLMLFRYEGNSSFHVLIFDKSGTEIQYPPSKNYKLEDHHVGIIDLDEDDTNISPSMYKPTKHEYVPVEFSTTYIIGMQFVTLQCLVLLKPIKTGLCSAMRFGKGWVAFSKDNNLEDGYVYVFKVIKRKPVVLSVSIFHVVDHQSLD
ncbi:hypothetical protein SO802_032300 [Lithocarpus litseifolius]|uniref:TF-B3 domain-containing protein n=1 Tax=Lithocarpus litseifolius TaxID=425828 RepID=A0AAW2BRE8_9ROSI